MPSIRQRFHLSPCSDFRSHFLNRLRWLGDSIDLPGWAAENWIYVSSNEPDGQGKIYAVRASDGGERRLVPDTRYMRLCAADRNQRLLTVSWHTRERPTVHVIRGNDGQVVDEREAVDPSGMGDISEDGRRVVWVEGRDTSQHVCISRLGDSNIAVLPKAELSAVHGCTWSRDGEHIAFAWSRWQSGGNDAVRVWVLHPERRQVLPLIQGVGVDLPHERTLWSHSWL